MMKTQLILLHFAGGDSRSFKFAEPYLKDFDLLVPELPGRGVRISEPLLTDFESAARDCFNQLLPRLTQAPFLIYGHSMGAYIGLRVTSLLEASGRMPAYLFVSGNPGPGVKEKKKLSQLDDKEFLREVKTMGGLSDEFLENEELMEFYLPILKSDFRISEHPMETAPVKTPLFAMMGHDEELVKEIGNWERFTTSNFACTLFPGDHFFIYKYPGQIARLIKEKYAGVCAAQLPAI